jgi:uncharacterized protein (TIGR03437 family)
MLLAITALAVIPASGQSIQVVNSASYAPSSSFAPGTIVSILGANLTNAILAAPDPANPPATLGGVSVMIGGRPAGLFFVSPSQINAHIDPAVPLGPASVTVTSPTGTFSTTTTISINVAAGLFSLTGTGSSEGAILNAITYALGPFTVTSPMGPTGSPIGPTYLAIYLTGLNLSASPVVTIGGVQVPVFYFGNAPCCMGLEQINVQLVPQLAGAGRIPVVVTAAGQTSNLVDVVILPNQGPGTPPAVPSLSGVVAIPNTSLGLVSDASANVVRVINTANKTVVQTIALPAGAKPGKIAVNSAGTLAVVVERALNAVAFLNLSTFQLLGQANVGHGPVSVAIVGNRAFVVNQDSDSVTVVDLTTFVPVTTIAVGRAPSSISVDTARNRLLVTNSATGTLSVIDLSTLAVTTVMSLDQNTRPISIRVVQALDLAVVTDASLKPGQIFVLDLLTGKPQVINLGGDQKGSWTALAVMGTTVFLLDPVDGQIGVVVFSRRPNKEIAFQVRRVNLRPGLRALDVDTAHGLLLVVSESGGTVALVDLNSNAEVGDVDATHDGDRH